MARFDSIRELAEYIGCPANDQQLIDLWQSARRLFVQSTDGIETGFELDLTQARPAIRAIRERLKQAESKTAAEATPANQSDDDFLDQQHDDMIDQTIREALTAAEENRF